MGHRKSWEGKIADIFPLKAIKNELPWQWCEPVVPVFKGSQAIFF
jgi:hypothetical protein